MLFNADGEPYDLHQAVMVVAVEEPKRLLDLRGREQSWDTLNAHNVLFWERRREREALPLRLSGACVYGRASHDQCSGHRMVANTLTRCECQCHEDGWSPEPETSRAARSITITEAGRAYLSALRAGQA